jgi:hypothetical protein
LVIGHWSLVIGREAPGLPDGLAPSEATVRRLPRGTANPGVSSVIPNSANDTLYIIGQRLDRTTGVMFSPGVPGEFVIESDTQLRVGVPPVAEPGLLVVETTFGWVLTESPSNPTSRRPSPTLRPRII